MALNYYELPTKTVIIDEETPSKDLVEVIMFLIAEKLADKDHYDQMKICFLDLLEVANR